MTVYRTISDLSEAAALDLLEHARSAARDLGKAFTIAVVDHSGHLKAFLRMDGAPFMSVQVAIDKGYTAAGFGRSTQDWYAVVEGDAVLAAGARSAIERLVTLGGGVPLRQGGTVIGGIGVSGGHYTEDVAVAEAAIKAVIDDEK